MFWTTRIPHRDWNPLLELEAAREQMNRLMTHGAHSTALPPTQLWASDEALHFSALVPGVAHENVEITVVDDVLTLAIKSGGTQAAESAEWRHRERARADSTRTFRLPYPVDAQRVKATLADGRLEVELPRAADDKPRRIAVQPGS